jgi:hypothetical protein
MKGNASSYSIEDLWIRQRASAKSTPTKLKKVGTFEASRASLSDHSFNALLRIYESQCDRASYSSAVVRFTQDGALRSGNGPLKRVLETTIKFVADPRQRSLFLGRTLGGRVSGIGIHNCCRRRNGTVISSPISTDLVARRILMQ